MNFMREFVAQLLTTSMVFAGLLLGFRYDWPDYVHTSIGLPLPWAIHTESTIMGPADIWSVNVTIMVADIAIWAALSLALVTVIGALERRRTVDA